MLSVQISNLAEPEDFKIILLLDVWAKLDVDLNPCFNMQFRLYLSDINQFKCKEAH